MLHDPGPGPCCCSALKCCVLDGVCEKAFVAASFDLQQEYIGKQENNAKNKKRSSSASQKGMLNIVVTTE
jgi:hypothetical protein